MSTPSAAPPTASAIRNAPTAATAIASAPGLVLSEAPYAELPEKDLAFVPLYYAGTLIGQTTGR